MSGNSSHIKYTDLTYLRSISDDDPEFIQEMISSYLSNTPEYIGKIKRLLKDEKWIDIGNIAHKMKPSIQFMGIEILKNTVLQIQINGGTEKNTAEIPKLIRRLEEVNEMAMIELRDILEKGLNFD